MRAAQVAARKKATAEKAMEEAARALEAGRRAEAEVRLAEQEWSRSTSSRRSPSPRGTPRRAPATTSTSASKHHHVPRHGIHFPDTQAAQLAQSAADLRARSETRFAESTLLLNAREEELNRREAAIAEQELMLSAPRQRLSFAPTGSGHVAGIERETSPPPRATGSPSGSMRPSTTGSRSPAPAITARATDALSQRPQMHVHVHIHDQEAGNDDDTAVDDSNADSSLSVPALALVDPDFTAYASQRQKQPVDSVAPSASVKQLEEDEAERQWWCVDDDGRMWYSPAS